MGGRGRKRTLKKKAPVQKKKGATVRQKKNAQQQQKNSESVEQKNSAEAKPSGPLQEKHKSGGLAQHKSNALEQHKCVLCNKQLSSKEALRDHFREHANESMKQKTETPPVMKVEPTNVSCDDCEQRFPTLREAIMHKHKQHPRSNTRFYCQHCGKHFPLKICKDLHVQSEHANQKPVPSEVCPECGATFYSKGALGFHTKTLHSGVGRLMSPIVTFPPSKKVIVANSGAVHSAYYCHLCGSEYVVKYNLQRHLENGHTAQERQAPPENLCRCTACEGVFYNRKAFETHNLTHTPDDIYVKSEEIRAKIVTKVDQDFNPQRVLPQRPFPYMGYTRPMAMGPVRSFPPLPGFPLRMASRPMTVRTGFPIKAGTAQTSKTDSGTGSKGGMDDDEIQVIKEKNEIEIIDVEENLTTKNLKSELKQEARSKVREEERKGEESNQMENAGRKTGSKQDAKNEEDQENKTESENKGRKTKRSPKKGVKAESQEARNEDVRGEMNCQESENKGRKTRSSPQKKAKTLESKGKRKAQSRSTRRSKRQRLQESSEEDSEA